MAPRRFITLCSPTSGDTISTGPFDDTTSSRMPSMPDSQRRGRSSACPCRPKVIGRTRGSAAAAASIAAPAGSSVFTTAAR